MQYYSTYWDVHNLSKLMHLFMMTHWCAVFLNIQLHYVSQQIIVHMRCHIGIFLHSKEPHIYLKKIFKQIFTYIQIDLCYITVINFENLFLYALSLTIFLMKIWTEIWTFISDSLKTSYQISSKEST